MRTHVLIHDVCIFDKFITLACRISFYYLTSPIYTQREASEFFPAQSYIRNKSSVSIALRTRFLTGIKTKVPHIIRQGNNLLVYERDPFLHDHAVPGTPWYLRSSRLVL